MYFGILLVQSGNEEAQILVIAPIVARQKCRPNLNWYNQILSNVMNQCTTNLDDYHR